MFKFIVVYTGFQEHVTVTLTAYMMICDLLFYKIKLYKWIPSVVYHHMNPLLSG